MKTVKVILSDDRSYDITIGSGAADLLKQIPIKGKKLLVYDDRTMELFRPMFSAMGDSVVGHFSFGRGEADKRMDKVLDICRSALQLQLDRSGAMVAVGGGVTGDLTGFAAGIYLRGIKCIQIPTTLLAMVDSSVGGKTAADLPEGKNLIGVFHQPSAVLIDPGFLRYLPPEELHCGLAEIIKMAVGFDAGFFAGLESAGSDLADFEGFSKHAEFAIGRCCELKAMVVSQDEKEGSSGIRAQLNFGHTFGHGIEGAGNFCFSHGECVAIGMVIAGLAAMRRGAWRDDEQYRMIRLLQAAGLPTVPPESLTFDEVLPVMTRDKKNLDGQITLILPRKLGELFRCRDFTAAELREVWCSAGGRI